MDNEVLKKTYITVKDIMKIMPISYTKALSYVNDIQQEMKEKNILVPETKEKVILTKLFKKKFGL